MLQYPDGNGKDQQINARALPVLISETVKAQSADIDLVSGATVTSQGYLTSLQGALDQAGLGSPHPGAGTRAAVEAGPAADPIRRRVVQVMGMPISLALRGRHIDDTAADSAWIRVVETLREVDLVFSTYRSDSVVSRLGRGEIDLADCPAEVREVLTRGSRPRSTAAARSVSFCPDRTGASASTRAAW